MEEEKNNNMKMNTNVKLVFYLNSFVKNAKFMTCNRILMQLFANHTLYCCNINNK